MVNRPHLHSPEDCREILGASQKCLRLFNRLRKSMRPGSSRKVLGNFAGVRHWRPPAAACQVIFYYIPSQKLVYRCRLHEVKIIRGWCWTPTRVCTVTIDEVVNVGRKCLQDLIGIYQGINLLIIVVLVITWQPYARWPLKALKTRIFA